VAQHKIDVMAGDHVPKAFVPRLLGAGNQIGQPRLERYVIVPAGGGTERSIKGDFALAEKRASPTIGQAALCFDSTRFGTASIEIHAIVMAMNRLRVSNAAGKAGHTRSGHLMSRYSSDQFIIIGMRPNPEPEQSVLNLDSQGAITESYANRPVV